MIQLLSLSLTNNPNIDGLIPTAVPSVIATPIATWSYPKEVAWIAPVVMVIALIILWLIIRPTRATPTIDRHSIAMIGVKGGKVKRTTVRNDNDIYTEELLEQQRRLRQFYEDTTI